MSTLPTSSELIERLRELHAARLGITPASKLSDERLASQLSIGLSTVNRWKKESPKGFTQAVEMLAEAGWLNEATNLAAEIDRPANSEDAAASLLLGQAEGLEILRRIETALRSEREARTPDAQTKKAASRRKR